MRPFLALGGKELLKLTSPHFPLPVVVAQMNQVMRGLQLHLLTPKSCNHGSMRPVL
jgi:hypothetical protein